MGSTVSLSPGKGGSQAPCSLFADGGEGGAMAFSMQFGYSRSVFAKRFLFCQTVPFLSLWQEKAGFGGGGGVGLPSMFKCIGIS